MQIQPCPNSEHSTDEPKCRPSCKHVRIVNTPLHTLLYTRSKIGVYRGICYFLIFDLKHRLWVLIRTASLRQFLCAPTINVLSKNKKNIKKFSSENYHFYSREILQYIAWACLHNDIRHCTKNSHIGQREEGGWWGMVMPIFKHSICMSAVEKIRCMFDDN